MTRSQAHEDLVDEWRAASLAYRNKHVGDPSQLGLAIDHFMAAMCAPALRDEELRADGYVLPFLEEADHGPIFLEVGSIKEPKHGPGKWSHILSMSDDKPARVLRISFLKDVWIVNPRHTKFEMHYLRFLQEWFERLKTA